MFLAVPRGSAEKFFCNISQNNAPPFAKSTTFEVAIPDVSPRLYREINGGAIFPLLSLRKKTLLHCTP